MSLKNKVPPPIIAAVFLALIYLTRSVANVQFPFQGYIAAVFLLAAISVMILGVREFRRLQTTVNPLKPDTATTLATNGVFKVSRNPMYLGLLGILIAGSVFFGASTAVVLVPLFVIYMNVFQISSEEEAMAKLFENDFKEYRSKVRRWI